MSERTDQEKCRIEVHYSGHVQGVGFRYTARSLARGFDVAGFVRNLPDGGVQLVVEATPDEARRFLDALASQLRHYVTSAPETIGPATGRFQGFEIRF